MPLTAHERRLGLGFGLEEAGGERLDALNHGISR